MYHPRARKTASARSERLTATPALAPSESLEEGGRGPSGGSVGDGALKGGKTVVASGDLDGCEGVDAGVGCELRLLRDNDDRS